MNSITIENFDDELKNRLQKQAEYHGRSLEEEAKEILRTVLTKNTENPLNLASAIERRFANFGDFELPTITREPLREPPHFEDLPRYQRSI
ncbi:MAG: plasmid stability protein [Phormidium sp.]